MRDSVTRVLELGARVKEIVEVGRQGRSSAAWLPPNRDELRVAARGSSARRRLRPVRRLWIRSE